MDVRKRKLFLKYVENKVTFACHPCHMKQLLFSSSHIYHREKRLATSDCFSLLTVWNLFFMARNAIHILRFCMKILVVAAAAEEYRGWINGKSSLSKKLHFIAMLTD